MAMLLTYREVAQAVRGEWITPPDAPFLAETVPGISIDTRSGDPRDLFVAVSGDRFDGHRFVGRALGAGARLAIVSAPERVVAGTGEGYLLRVADTRAALADLARYYRAKFPIPVIGITGSNGKTTTKEIVAHLLGGHFPLVKSEGSYNNLIGVPLTIFKLRADTRVLVCEMGTDTFGQIGALTGILQPTIGVITTIGPAHLAGLGDLEGVFRAKTEMLRSFGPAHTAVLNGDDRFLNRIADTPYRVVRFGSSENATVRFSALTRDNDGSSCLIDQIPLRVGLLGLHNLYNALAAICCAQLLGIPYEESARRIASFRAPGMRLEPRRAGGVLILSDGYNANPDSTAQAVRTLAAYRTPGRRFLVLGDMLDLGASSAALHRQVGEEIGRTPIDLVVTCGDQARYVGEGLAATGARTGHVHCAHRDEVAPLLAQRLEEQDVVLCKGSRGMGIDVVVDQLTALLTEHPARIAAFVRKG